MHDVLAANVRVRDGHDQLGGQVMTKTPKWLPDGSGIDPDSLNGDTVVETVTGFYRARRTVGPIIRVFADVTPPKPDPASLTCKHCHKPIRSVNFYDGPGWTHADEMIGRWCQVRMATPDDAPCVWDDSVAPGGFVCGVCRLPVESEPCRKHQPGAFAESQR